MLTEAVNELTRLREEQESELNGDIEPQDAARMNALDTAISLAKSAVSLDWLKERLGNEYRESMRTAQAGTIKVECYTEPTKTLDPWHEARAKGFHLALARLQQEAA